MIEYQPLYATLLIIIISNAETYLMTINWNISTVLGSSGFERDYKYPMYQEVAPAPCDLTPSCDAFCCQDPDCDKNDISQCLESEPSSNCNGFLSVFDCSCNNFDKPEWMSVFCYIYKNPVYLGKFYKTPKKIEKFAVLKNAIHKTSLFRPTQNKKEQKVKPSNLLGSPIMTFVPMSESFPSVSALLRKIPLKDSTYACTSGPVSYRLNGTGICLAKITRQLCQNGNTLGILPYLVLGDNSSVDNNVPVVLKDSDLLEGLKTVTMFTCVELKLNVMGLKKQELNFFQEGSKKACPISLNTFHTVLINNICLNVLVYVHYWFIVNGSDIVKLKVEYGLTNISLPIESSENKDLKYIYLKQKFSAHFFDIMHKSYENESQAKYEDTFNRGYFIGEELNFGYKRINNASAFWKTGILGIFGSGGSCYSSSPITFGFNFLSVCRIRPRFPNCTQLRSAVEEIFEALLQGDRLAVYANLRPPYNNTVPLLRNYHKVPSASGESSENFTQCLIPVVQKVLIQYTSIFTERGSLIHRVVGLRVDRGLQNISMADAEIRLTAHALFFYVSSSKEKPLSRFWEKMFSRELSENSWLNIFNAFDDVNSVELEEITFWCSVLVVCGAATIILFCKVDVHLGKLF